jgi:hypothetical protein
MRGRTRWLVGWLCALLLASTPAAGFVVHEWGTFTTHHGPDGEPYVWAPLQVPSDLPTFVHLATSRATRKHTYPGTVRMETPVLYFYGDAPETVSVSVGFPSGMVTEWFPRAKWSRQGIRWPRVTILPGATAPLLREEAPSHYYPARETDAAIVRCGRKAKTQHEKFLFYRGVGTFDTPLRVRLEGDAVHVRVTGPDAVARGLVFERRGEAAGLRAVDLAGGGAVVDRPAPTDDAVELLEAELHAALVAEGLFDREARAMLATWRDTWSEQGLRVLYVVPRRLTDVVLPLTIEPEPSGLERVLVGRAEFAPDA